MVISRGANSVEKAVRTSDVDFFTGIPRLGKKNAQKIIIELKNKLGGLTDIDLNEASDGDEIQIRDALLSMGFEKKEILLTLNKISGEDGDISVKLRQALKLLGR
jgi:Holliday junction DNA helicase RuvA